MKRKARKAYKAGDLAKLIRLYWWEYEALNKHPSGGQQDSSEFDALVAATIPRIEKSLIGVPALSHADALAAVEWLQREEDVADSVAFDSIIEAVRGYVVDSMRRDERAKVVPIKAA